MNEKDPIIPGLSVIALFLVGGLATLLGATGNQDSLTGPAYLLVSAVCFGFVAFISYRKN